MHDGLNGAKYRCRWRVLLIETHVAGAPSKVLGSTPPLRKTALAHNWGHDVGGASFGDHHIVVDDGAVYALEGSAADLAALEDVKSVVLNGGGRRSLISPHSRAASHNDVRLISGGGVAGYKRWGCRWDLATATVAWRRPGKTGVMVIDAGDGLVA